MKVFKRTYVNYLYLVYRIIEPIIDPVKFLRGIYGYLWFIRDLIKYQKLSKKKSVRIMDLYPRIHDRSKITPFDSHYFYQQIWAFGKIKDRKPKSHVDIASTYELSGYLSKLLPTTFVDIRPIETNLQNLTVINQSILRLRFSDSSLDSISCLHVLEHIGLGRYGDDIDPDGMKKACAELSRVLRPGGRLYISTPIGKNRICFNAHRVTDPELVLSFFPHLKLLDFSCISDDGKYLENQSLTNYKTSNYACGLFVFTKS